MRLRARRFEGKIAVAGVEDLRHRDSGKSRLKHSRDKAPERRMKRQQCVVNLGKIMAIPERLQILANHGLQQGAHARDASELGECGRKSAEMMQHVYADDRVDRARAQRNRRCVGESPMRRGLVGANFNHRGRAVERYYRQAVLGQCAGIIAVPAPISRTD